MNTQIGLNVYGKVRVPFLSFLERQIGHAKWLRLFRSDWRCKDGPRKKTCMYINAVHDGTLKIELNRQSNPKS